MAYENVKTQNPLLLKILPFLGIGIFFAVWEIVVDVGILPSTMMASPYEVIKLFIDKLSNPNPDGSTIGIHAWRSAQEAVTAYILAFVMGTPLGLLMGWYKVARGLARPVFELIRPIPPIAWIPLCIFWFGIGITGKIFIIWIAGIVPFTINAWVGVNMTNPTFIQMARTYGASDWQIFKTVCVPSALPMVFGALQISLAYCWTNLVGAELLAADQGLGYLISMGRRLAMPSMVVLGMVTVGLGGAIIGVIVDMLEKRFMSRIRR